MMNVEMTLDDVAVVVGRLFLENSRLVKQIPLLEEQIQKLTEEVTQLRNEIRPNVVLTKPESVSEAAA